MTNADFGVDDFDRLLSSFCDARINDRDLDRLNDLLRSHRALRRRYLHFVGLHADLSYLFSDNSSIRPEPRPVPMGTATDANGRQGISRENRRRRRTWHYAVLAASAALLLGGLFGSTVGWLPPRILPALGRSFSPIAARIDREAGARFDNKASLADADGALRTGTYRLVDGIVRASFGRGAEVVVIAPAEFEVQSDSRILLKNGRLSARVPEEAKGFTVETPSATLIDIGTEFAAEVDHDGNSEVHVFRGEVIVKPRSLTDARPLRLLQSQATRIDAASATPSGIEVDPARFLRRLDEPETPYSRIVMQLDPQIYLRMEPPADGKTLIDSGSFGRPGRLELSPGLATPWLPGRLGSAVNLRGPSFGDYVTVRVPSTSFPKSVSVAAWIYAESRPRWATIVKRWGFVGECSFHFGLWGDDGDLEAHIAGPGADESIAREGRPLPTGGWHHVAFVVDESTLRLYRDGVEVAKTKHSGLNPSHIGVISVGAKLTGTGDAADPIEPGFWHGRIDEVAIFSQPLEPYQVQQMYRSTDRSEDSRGR